jgi:hypothetical protein
MVLVVLWVHWVHLPRVDQVVVLFCAHLLRVNQVHLLSVNQVHLMMALRQATL